MQLLKINSNFCKDIHLEQDFTNIVYNLWTNSSEDNRDYIFSIIQLWSKVSKERKIDNYELTIILDLLNNQLVNNYFISNNYKNSKDLIAYIKALSINAFLNYMIDFSQIQLCDVLLSINQDWKPIKINWHEIMFFQYNWKRVMWNVIAKFIWSQDDLYTLLLLDTNIWLQFLLDWDNNIILQWTKISCFTDKYFVVSSWKGEYVYDEKGNIKYWWLKYIESIKFNYKYYLLDFCEKNKWIFWLVDENWKQVFGGKVRKSIISNFVHNWKSIIHGITLDGSKIVVPE